MNLFEIPFDQYQRYRAVADLLDALPGEAPRIALEVGGGAQSRLRAFLPRTEIVVVDLEVGVPSRGVRFVRADGRRSLPFAGGSFPAAVTLDTLEHLEADARRRILREMRRVTTGPIIAACPVGETSAKAAELALETFYRVVFGEDHRWLAEHRAYGLPRADAIDEAIAGLGGKWRSYENGYLPEWQALMLLNLLCDGIPGGPGAVPELRAANAHYNERHYPFANRAPAYRKIWIQATTESELPDVAVAGMPEEKDSRELDRLLALAGDALVRLHETGDPVGAELRRERRRAQATIDHLQRRLRWLRPLELPLEFLRRLAGPLIRPAVRRLRSRGAPYGPATRRRLSRTDGPAPTRGHGETASVSVIVLGTGHADGNARARTLESLRAQQVPPASVIETVAGRDRLPSASDLRVSHVCFVVAGDRLAPNALAEVSQVLAESPTATVVCTDEDDWPVKGERRRPDLRGAWDHELVRAGGTPAGLACFRTDLLEAVPSECDPAELLYALGLAVAEHSEQLAHHIPLVLLHRDPATAALRRLVPESGSARSLLADHLRRIGDPGTPVPAPPGFRIDRPVEASLRASIVVPFRDRSELLSRCVEAVRSRTQHPSWELILVDNGSRERRTLRLLDEWSAEDERIRVLRDPSPFNFSALANLGARHGHGEVVVFLNNDTEVLTDGWLKILLGLAKRPGIGAVGSLLLFPDGTIQHCGIVLGLGTWPGQPHGVAGLFLRGCPRENAHPALHAFDRTCSAVTAACLAIRRNLYLEVGGMDERFGSDFNDVDLCLKLQARGLRNLYTPHVRILHKESATRDSRATDPAEVDLMYSRWEKALASDPHVSPHFDLSTTRPALAIGPVARVT